MSNLNHWKILKIIFALALAIGWGLAIFHLSAMDSTNSNDASTGIVDLAIRKVLIVTNSQGITDFHPTDEQIDYAAALVNAPLRKVFHAGVYFVLAILIIIVGCVLFSAKRYWIICLSSLILCVIFAITDEYHQTFVSGRTGQTLDVVIDSIGAIFGNLIATSYYLAWRIGKISSRSTESPTKSEIT